jgi:hypothetical protein
MNRSSSASWASGALDGDPAEALRIIENNFAVHLIATPRSSFKTCAADDNLASVVEHNRPYQFDFLPVTESKSGNGKPNQIIGLIELVSFLDQVVDSEVLVRRHMRPLSEENLIGADAGILDFVRDADRQRCRLVISGREIGGLVTLPDLHRLPVRAALFTMVTHLEILMAEFIRYDCVQSDEWLTHLSEGRQENLRKEVDKSRKGDAFVDELLFTQFADKVTIIKKSALMLANKNQFKKDLRRVQNLRDALAHANNYAASRDEAIEVCTTVRIMDEWIERFARWVNARVAPRGAA